MKKLSKILIIGLISLLTFGCGSSSDPVEEPPKEEVSYEITYQNLELSKSDYSEEVFAYAVWEIVNDGTVPLFISGDDCDIEDKDGNFIGFLSGYVAAPQVIGVGEKGYFIAWDSLGEADPDAEYTMLPKVDAKKATVEHIRLATSETSIRESSFGDVEVFGRVENHLEEEITVDIYVVLFDAEGKPIWVINEHFIDLNAGETSGFECSAFIYTPSLKLKNVDRYEVYAYDDKFQFN